MCINGRVRRVKMEIKGNLFGSVFLFLFHRLLIMFESGLSF
jgi:hypothetical protein